MGSINLTAEPDFTLPVKIQRLGQEPAEVKFNMVHRDTDAFDALCAEAGKDEFRKTDDELLLLAAKGWALSDEFSPDNVRRLCQKYPGAGLAVWKAYLGEYTRARLGN